ncbi:ROK family protein [Leptolyngbya sp. FACHB-261]|uniref:ROK family protein n=1 Tax=Leptolyngbya sp. FACHB-261 TaxID=2692806 RepID=UPI001682BB72|nr:ROK family protein [Leptolyngbya sp. FACHB-261]MBD2099326.1 ROK family protein [Leptolyngbya sp. FACHB-261]
MGEGRAIGIDLGGTNLKLGLYSETGSCLGKLMVPTPQPASPEAVTSAMVAAIEQLDPDRQATVLGVGTPGPTDVSGRVALVAINLAGWQDVTLADWLEARTGRRVVLANDANCAGLGEAWLGAGREFQDLIVLTLGTGVGGAIILNGQLFSGHRGAAGELGLIALYPQGHPCNSGNQGSLEQYCSIGAIRRRTGSDPKDLSVLARQGDATALAHWQAIGSDLGIGLSSLIYVLTPQAVLLGGGVSAGFEFFQAAMQAEIERRVLPSSRTGLVIRPAALGNEAGTIGAARLAFQHLVR